MAVTDYKYAGTTANVDRDSGPGWLNPDNAKADDTSYASCSLNKLYNSDWLLLTNFGFTSGDIPNGATIDGIEFVIGRKSRSIDVSYDSALYLYDDGQVGNNLASATKWPTSISEATYGGAMDMCGTSLTQADIVATTFGVQLSAYGSSSESAVLDVDFIKIRVYYTAGGASLPLKNVFNRPFHHMLIR